MVWIGPKARAASFNIKGETTVEFPQINLGFQGMKKRYVSCDAPALVRTPAVC